MTLPPIAWTIFKATPPVAKTAWPAIINRAVNHAIDASPSAPVAGEPWQLWPKVGHCHDYAVTKREELMARGYSAGELLLAIVQLPDGEYHMVLVVEGIGMLDSLTEVIGPMRYRVVQMQSRDDPDDWISVLA